MSWEIKEETKLSVHEIKQDLGFLPRSALPGGAGMEFQLLWFSRINGNSFHYQNDYMPWMEIRC